MVGIESVEITFGVIYSIVLLCAGGWFFIRIMGGYLEHRRYMKWYNSEEQLKKREARFND